MKKKCIKSLSVAILLMLCMSSCSHRVMEFDADRTNEVAEPQHIVESSGARGWQYFWEGNYENSLEVLYLALELIESEDLPRIADHYNQLGLLHGRLGNHERSDYYLNKALTIAQLDDNAPARLRALRNFIMLHALRGDVEQFDVAMDIKAVIRDSLLMKQYEVRRKSELLAKQTEEVLRRRNNNIFLLIILFLTTALFIATILFYRQKMRSMVIAVRQQEELIKYKKEAQPRHKDVEKTDASERLASELQQLFEEEKIYRRQGLSADEVVKRLNTNSKYLSNVLRQHFGKNFTGYVNTFRVEEAIEILKQQQNKDSKYANYTIQAIAEEVGFNGKSSFYLAFSQIIGVAPLEYIKVLKDEAEG